MKEIIEPIKIQKINFSAKKTSLRLRIKPEINKTSRVQNFDKQLLEILPSLNLHACDNRDKKCFADELVDTEIAHAFEHALIDIIGKNDEKVEIIGGFTTWNWQKNPRWTYDIHINYTNKKIILESVAKTLAIFDSIMKC